ncbi:MAG: Dam family site-specific DNA-(adenine-N6)-methyltransferase [Anaerolineaceae bacterium]
MASVTSGGTEYGLEGSGTPSRPFLKWAGGKAKLAPAMLDRAPRTFNRYHEPFLGAGAVFFAFRSRRSFPATLTDVNATLIETFQVVRDDPNSLHRELTPLADVYLPAPHDERARLYYQVRASTPATAAARAARLIFLNRTCFNGLYRENRSGRFNVPHGRYQRPTIHNASLLGVCSEALQAADLVCGDFESACARAAPGDFVYLDPPYHPLSTTSSFTNYTSGVFGFAEQVRLRDAFDSLSRRGVAAILSNSNHPAIRELYGGRGYLFETVEMARAINAVGSKRAPIPELLISNFS